MKYISLSSRACGSYQDFLDRGLLLTRKLLNQGFLLVRLKSSLKEKVLKDKHTHKTKDRVTRTPLKTGVELLCSGRVDSSCSTSGTHRVNLVTSLLISHEWGKGCIYPIEIKDTTDTARSAANLDLHLEVDSEGRLRTKLYDKRDDLNFPIVKFPFICSNIIPAAPVYEVYIS
jgi:hypothetical protein